MEALAAEAVGEVDFLAEAAALEAEGPPVPGEAMGGDSCED